MKKRFLPAEQHNEILQIFEKERDHHRTKGKYCINFQLQHHSFSWFLLPKWKLQMSPHRLSLYQSKKNPSLKLVMHSNSPPSGHNLLSRQQEKIFNLIIFPERSWEMERPGPQFLYQALPTILPRIASEV